MKGAGVRLMLVALAAATPGLSATEPAENRATVGAVATAAARGAALFVHDSAAATATDELMNRKILGQDTRLRGWLTDVVGEHVHVTFVGEVAGAASALYRVRVPAGDGLPEFEALARAEPLDESQAARWTARQDALGRLEKRKDLCSPRYNTVVLPADPGADEMIHVYLLAATDKAGEIVAGGHFRYDYSTDGRKLEATRSFTKSCFTIEAPDESKGKPVAFFLTHLLDPTPTEIHVFLSRLHGQNVIVGTSYGTWVVDGSNIKLQERRKD